MHMEEYRIYNTTDFFKEIYRIKNFFKKDFLRVACRARSPFFPHRVGWDFRWAWNARDGITFRNNDKHTETSNPTSLPTVAL